ncbi:MAG: heparin lyase I family protein [Chloroflexota bacterium]
MSLGETAVFEPAQAHQPTNILWQTDHETGNFYDWAVHNGWNFWNPMTEMVVDEGSGPRIFGYTIQNSNTPPGDCVSTISDEVARSGRFSLKMTLWGATDNRSQGCRTFRSWTHIDGGDGTPLPDEGYYSAWYYLPQEVTTDVWWNVFQFKSRSETASDPMLSFNIESDGNGTRSLYVYHEKPHVCQADCASSSYGNDAVNLPLREWFHVEAFVRQSSSGETAVRPDGTLIVWVNGVEIVNKSNIYTLRSPRARLQWSVNNYTDSIEPDHVVLYVDDAAISRTRLGAKSLFEANLPIVTR